MFRTISVLTLTLVYFFSLPLAFAEKQWNDVNIDHPYIEAIDSLKNEGIIGGFPDGTFKPENFLTRAEALKVVIKSLDITIPENIALEDVDFPDLEDNWYLPFVRYALLNRIMQGYEDGTFRPDEPMTRAEYAKIVHTAKNMRPRSDDVPLFSDVTKEDWYARYVSNLSINKNLPDNLGDTFQPNEYITRALASEILYRKYFLNTSVQEQYIQDLEEEEPIIEEPIEETPIVAPVEEPKVPEIPEVDPITPEEEPVSDLQKHLVDTNLDSGIASYYHDMFIGRNTANGEKFDNEAMTAAHPYLPIHSVIKVTNIDNDQSVEVRINDCGPFSTGRARVVDLTRAAFELIGPLGSGLLDVEVEVISLPEDGKFRNYCYKITER